MKKNLLGLLGLLMIWSCEIVPRNKQYNESAELKGEIIIDGSSTVAPISSAVAEEFLGKNKGVNIAIGISVLKEEDLRNLLLGEIDKPQMHQEK